MSKPIRFISPFLLSSFLILLFACGKEEPHTVIKGKVTDKKSGLPIDAAYIDIDFRTEKTEHGSYVTEHEYVSLSTDQQGEFDYTYDSDFTSIYSELHKHGYAFYSPLKIHRGEVNDLDIKLAPIDGTLRLEVINNTGQFDSIYIIIENPSRILGYGSLGKIFVESFPLTLSVNGSYVKYFNLPSEEFTKVHWGFTRFTSLNASPFRDSVYLTLNDTTEYILSF